MDEDVRTSNPAVRWLAWAAAGLLVAGAVSVGTVTSGGTDAGQNISVAGGSAGAVDLPSPVTAPPAPPVASLAPPVLPSTTAVATTAVPRPPVTVRAPVSTTTAPRTPVTAAPAPTTTSTIAVASVQRATVTVVNAASSAYVITVNGTVFQLGAGTQAGPALIDLYAHGNDIIEVRAVADPACALGDADNYFDAGGRYKLTVVDAPGLCRNAVPGPGIRVTPI